MSKQWNGELDELEDKEEEFVEVKDPRVIQALVKADEEEKAKAQEASILKIIDDKQSPSSPPTKAPVQPKFIQDDRERVQVKL